MNLLADILEKARAQLRSLITVRVGTYIVTIMLFVLGSGWAAVYTFGRSYASQVAISLVKPVTDSVATVARRADSTAKAVQDTVKALQITVAENRRLQEITIAAQRRADPKYDRALREMATASDEQQRRERENHDLIQRIRSLTR